MEEIRLGDRVRDRITGFEGVAVGRTDWMFGCSRIGIEPTELREGKPIEAQWFDVQRVDLVKPEAKEPPARTGGPRNDPPLSRGMRA